MSSTTALSTGLSSLQSNQRALDVEAHNVANANTQNFQPQQAKFTEAAPAGTGVTLSVEGRERAADVAGAPSGTDLADSLTKSLVYGTGAQFAAELIKAEDQRLGTLLDTKA
ncbi:flagellar basal body protein [Massilia endophytica]|uniref:flagellar basal body protein n=1 Tax=Massilia endophytica TaxID=2899220 RepID=UPI001E5EA1E1|nr:flagellar basal body protein [Massilia endophytica]UGQ49038.1 flagellar basal body protein [Massilia endophytica]